MAYPRSPPASSSHDDWDSRGPQPLSKAYSTSSSRSAGGGGHGRAQSITSQSSRGTSSANNASYETAARTFYGELKKFLASVLAKGWNIIFRFYLHIYVYTKKPDLVQGDN